ncbi:MAG: rhodanese-like domain-containing protein [Pseudomonadota bacterium]
MDEFTTFLGNHYLLTSAWLVVAILIVLSYIQSAASGSKNLTPQQAISLMNKDEALVVDVRSAAEYRKGHILGAINIALDKLEEKNVVLEKKQEGPIIIVCPNGLQSGTAVLKLKKLGYKNVHKLNGGLQTWKAENMPVHTA